MYLEHLVGSGSEKVLKKQAGASERDTGSNLKELPTAKATE